jgi:hypothetical protein
MIRARFVLAALAAAALIVSAPFISIIRNTIRDTFPGQFILILGSAIAGCIAIAVVAAVLRIRNRRVFRYGCIAAAIAIGTTYSLLTSSPDPTVAIVERFHFVEYGILTFLFYRTWRPLEDGGVLILPVLAAMLTATVEEWFQWFIPGRVGAVADVFLNWVAILCGLLFSIGAEPPAAAVRRPGARSRRHIGVAGLLFVVTFGAFFETVHVGHRIDVAAAGSFASLYTPSELDAHARDRASRWPTHPPIDKTRLAREDQYRTEGIQHVRERNRAWDAGDFDAAWRENLILEEYYAPVLDTGHRWPPEQRQDAQQRAAARSRPMPYVSAAYPYPVYAWGWWWWLGMLGLAAVIVRWIGRERVRSSAG